MRFIIAPLIIFGGILMMKYSVQIAGVTGMVDFAEKYLTGGLAGTYTLYKLIGLGFCILGLAYLFGVIHFSPPAPDIISAPESYLPMLNFA